MRNYVARSAVALVFASVPIATAEREVQFNRDIRPILSENCFSCHGPDEAKRMTSLRLDTPEAASTTLSGGRRAIDPGQPESSEIYVRVASRDPIRRMPPEAMGHEPLADREVNLIRSWIEEGAEWQGHWAFIPPQLPEIPVESHPGWPVNPVDNFVLRRLRQEGVSPSPLASRETLIRRLSLDLTGLPPSMGEVDTFLKDSARDAYEIVVDRLLASPHFGERMAIRWLDAARYADTNGYQTDAQRDMWRWRDWVIEAFASNKPFDRFTVEQLAGDMLPDATLDQMIATGFNRNHRGNGEGGIVDAEYAVEYVVDRVDTTATVWLGLTVGCARCHDHKYDPITQKEYYSLFAYFNNVPEKGKAFKYGNSPPFIKAPTTPQADRLAAMEAELASLRKRQLQIAESSRDAREAWAAKLAGAPAEWIDSRDLEVRFPEGAENPAPPEHGFVKGEFADLGEQANFGFYDRFSVTAWIRPEAPDGAIVSKTRHVLAEDDTQANPGWGFYLKNGKLQVNLINRWLDDCLRLETREAVELGAWQHVGFTYDGTRLASGVKIYVNGRPAAFKIVRDEMNQEFKSKEPLRVGRGLGLDYHGSIRRLLVYGRALEPEEMGVAAVARSLDSIGALTQDRRSTSENRKLESAYANAFGPVELTSLTARVRDLEQEHQAYLDSVPTVMVMQEMTPRRKTYRLDRGAYDAPAEEVLPGLPASLSRSEPANRLEFARWLVSPDNPLTARVIVNRVWQMLWGTGIVETVEDFGSQGAWPTHPDLLDWLAVDFMESGWDFKRLVKTIVTSAAYRQASRIRPEMQESDPANRLFARGPRLRLPAEGVRDLSLTVSGLMVDAVGGPSVNPYQPAGLWTELAGGEDYEVGEGSDLYRRSLYTFWKRAVPPPSMMLFDSAGREACTVRSVRTNTPLQALNRMNDGTYMEASRALAVRALAEAGSGSNERLRHIFRLATARQPSDAEANILQSGYGYHLDRFQGDPEAARDLVGSSASKGSGKMAVPETELAAYSMMASLVLNLDETITKE